MAARLNCAGTTNERACRERRIEKREAVRRRHRDKAATAHARAIALVEMACHPGRLRPPSPRHRDSRQPLLPAMLCERIEECIGGRVVGLARGAENTGCRRKQHERRQVRGRGEFVQVPRRIDLRPQHRVQVTWRLCREHGVVEHPGGVDNGGQRMLDRYPGQESLQRISVRRVARCDPYGSTELG